MRIVQIAQMIDATTPYDERLKGAVQRVLNGKLIADAADIYGVALEDLSKGVLDERRLQSLPVKEILEIRNRASKPTVNNIAETLKLEPTDVAWVLRKLDTQRNVILLKKELEMILQLHDTGKTHKQIAEKLDINYGIIAAAIRKYRGLHHPSGKEVKEVADKACNDFLAFSQSGFDREKSINEVLSKYPMLTRKKLQNLIFHRGLGTGRSKGRPFSFGEYLQVKQLMLETPNMTLKNLAKACGRSDECGFRDFLKKQTQNGTKNIFRTKSPKQLATTFSILPCNKELRIQPISQNSLMKSSKPLTPSLPSRRFCKETPRNGTKKTQNAKQSPKQSLM